MYSPNVPVPGRVIRLASDLFPYLALFDRVRDRYTLVCERFEDADLNRLREQLRHTLIGQPTFEARVTDIRFSEEPPRGTAPVVYLAVDSSDLLDLRRTFTDDSGTIKGIEGGDYAPHVTLARGGSIAGARTVVGQPLDPIEQTVSQLDIYDSSFRETTVLIPLPA